MVIVVRAPVFDEESGFGQGAKPMLVKAVVAEGAIEALDEGVLHRFARLDMMESNAGALSPEVEGFAGKLGAIVHGDGLGKPTRESQALENGNDRGPADGGVDMGMARHWPVKSSTSVRQRKRRPVASWSWMKSIDQRSLGPGGTESDTRATAGSFRRRLRRRESPSSR